MSKISVSIERQLDEYIVKTTYEDGNEGNFHTGSEQEALLYAKGFLSSEVETV